MVKPDQQYYLRKKLASDYIITYKPGKSNVTADALSKCDDPTFANYFILPMPSYKFLPTLSENNNLLDLQKLHKKVHNSAQLHPTLKIIGGILYYKGKPYLS